MPSSSPHLSSDLISMLDQCVARLESDIAQTAVGSCETDVRLLIERMQLLKSEVPRMNRDVIGDLYAKIKRSVYDGAFATPEPGRVYVDIDRIFQRWRTQVLYAESEKNVRGR